MKKISILFLVASCALLSSCDMDLKPWSSLNVDDAVQTLKDVRSLRNNLYSNYRGLCTGGYIAYPDIQMDDFHATLSYQNRVGTFYSGTFTSSDGDVESFWGTGYSVVNQANYLLQKATDIKSQVTDPLDNMQLRRYRGEAYFSRAFAYNFLAEKFCQPYTAGANNYGLPIQLTYSPTSDNAKYPGRSTMAETYAQINTDLDSAYNCIKNFEANWKKSHKAQTDDLDSILPKPMTTLITSDLVVALQARVALAMGNYQVAAAKASSLIESGTYPLATKANYASMWTTNVTTEALFRPEMSATRTGGVTGGEYMRNDGTTPDYLPSGTTMQMYDSKNDVRFTSFFTKIQASDNGGNAVTVYGFNKYPESTLLSVDGKPNFVHFALPFRISEMYLIAIEAYAHIGDAGSVTKANKYLNDLRTNRINNYNAQTLSAELLLNEVKLERHRELLGEGFRFFDLKRWGLPFQRGEAYDETVLYTAGGVLKLQYAANDYRYTYPIPKAELDANPQISGQQNPGY